MLLEGTANKTDVLLLMLMGLALAWIMHKYLTTKAGGKSRVGRGTTYVNDGRKLLQEGRSFLRKALLFATFVLIIGMMFFRILARIMLN